MTIVNEKNVRDLLNKMIVDESNLYINSHPRFTVDGVSRKTKHKQIPGQRPKQEKVNSIDEGEMRIALIKSGSDCNEKDPVTGEIIRKYPETDEVRVCVRFNNKLHYFTLGDGMRTKITAPTIDELEDKQRVISFVEAGSESGGLPASDEVRIYTRFNNKLYKTTLIEVV